MRCIPSLITREQPKDDPVKEASQQVVREPGTQPSLHSEDTATEETRPSAEASSNKEDFIAVLKTYATKVYNVFPF